MTDNHPITPPDGYVDDWPASQHIVPTDIEIPTLISYERLDEVKLGDRIWQAYMNTKKEEQQ